ncbi:AAA family ATPase [Stratiformator vulcanicus]|uniref:ATPase family associated with various cellular activities (AAA) n=1 Tax=Stratiformator vulcanicus TaxID=2527980 RepID=A0A517R454_9PLAN|nr:MoxR family ATPase [Stratiformator vulcanicus]QDT38675.1 ATPase family associated with various cellular activities (AAA) [Stratiformator vulcanicus]
MERSACRPAESPEEQPAETTCHQLIGPLVSTAELTSPLRQFEETVASVLLGKPRPIRLAVVCLLADGHILIEDSPGVGKTSLAKSIAKGLAGTFTRLQFTPDMLPSDILGASLFMPNMGEFEFRRGPIFTNVLLADEINRTTPRTQSALLEAMSEHQVSVEGRTYPLEDPFFVIATQNPFESEGTYPLPENQLDRFMICTDIGYPDRQFEKQALEQHRRGEPVEVVEPAISGDELQRLKAAVRDVTVEDSINDYLLDIVEATRNHDELQLGVSTRGILTLYRAVQAYAYCEGRTFVTPDDVKELAVPVLAHRIVCKSILRERQRDRSRAIIHQILDEVAVPS